MKRTAPAPVLCTDLGIFPSAFLRVLKIMFAARGVKTFALQKIMAW